MRDSGSNIKIKVMLYKSKHHQRVLKTVDDLPAAISYEDKYLKKFPDRRTYLKEVIGVVNPFRKLIKRGKKETPICKENDSITGFPIRTFGNDKMGEVG